MQEVAIIDSGGANLASLQFALERLGARSRVTVEPDELLSAPRVLLPGVGSAGDAMQRLRAAGLAEVIPRIKSPLLGICLGMQLLYDRSEEGDATGLGILAGEVRAIASAPGLRVPHMGWNTLVAARPDPLLDGIGAADHFYFVHSYAAAPGPAVLAESVHGAPFAAVARRGNFWATQFHPERSGRPGARLLKNFLGLKA